MFTEVASNSQPKKLPRPPREAERRRSTARAVICKQLAYLLAVVLTVERQHYIWVRASM